jgi:hypothetical protein
MNGGFSKEIDPEEIQQRVCALYIETTQVRRSLRLNIKTE